MDPDLWWIHLEAGLIDHAAQSRKNSQRELDLAASLIDDPALRRALETVRAELA